MEKSLRSNEYLSNINSRLSLQIALITHFHYAFYVHFYDLVVYWHVIQVIYF